ncbi:sulfite exporter TauE/SafE family protein [Phaeovibrio sulfidiphilus]|uniref:Probable membrane transporter protein n=1 Tax=Phaeovibrio sulfidiphilus TaxID=1220600 RepID=A0A8J6YXH4_9PROT|nr:sulfite exporter TauE/SafE family protein [Phaeovibrio sulfidiphilus]MBE1237452.1 sulfite exporter TauE/SafE family protein [Phaeovibrio sulfidiphilus]
MDGSFLLPLALYLACGALAGFLGGLLGIGGGVFIVALLITLLPSQGVPPEHIYTVAIATSLASIVVTSLSSSITHYRKGAVRLDILKSLAPGMFFGTLLGAGVASYAPSLFLQTFIVLFLFFVGSNMLFNFLKPKAERPLPGPVGTALMGGGIGAVSSWVGVAGGALTVPFLTFCSVPLHTAIGTAAAGGFPIALGGTIGYLIGGWNEPNLPPFMFGYIHLIAFAGISFTSFLLAPLGARTAHRMPVKTLRRIFAVFLLAVATRLLWKLVETLVDMGSQTTASLPV